MQIDILINQLDEHNQGSILASKKFNPKEVIYIRGANEESSIKSLQSYYQNYMSKVVFKDLIVEEGDKYELNKLINIYKDKNVLINLTGGKRINSLILLKLCNDNNLKSIYMDVKNKVLYEIYKDINIIAQEFEDLEIDEFVKASGGEVLENSNRLCKKKDLVYLTKKIYNNLNLWHEHKQKLYDSNIFTHDCTNSKRIIVKIDMLDKKEKKLIDNILVKLKEIGGISYNKLNSSQLEVNFLNDYLKAFIFKSGTWLEMATNMMINEIDDIDEVKSGLIFLWNDDVRVVRNEVDVVAMKDSIPICISCKDSDKYNGATCC